jgi:hypothetical protein
LKHRALAGARVWAFPRGKPQLFSDSPQGLSEGVLVYAFGRRIPRPVQAGIALQMRLPGIRRLFAERHRQVEPVCGWELWDSISDRILQGRSAPFGGWLLIHSQWDKPRSSAIGLNGHAQPEFFLTIEPFGKNPRASLSPVSSFRVPACLDSFRVGDWSVRKSELLPRFHRPAEWDMDRIRQVAADASRALDGVLERSPEIPSHWRPMHGDLVPWNLREDHSGQLWLVDWEDAGWGPPWADYVRYIVAYQSLRRSSADRIAARVRTTVAAEPAGAIEEAARFWLQHRNLRPLRNTQRWPRRKARDVARGAREFAAFRSLAYTVEESMLTQEPASSR